MKRTPVFSIILYALAGVLVLYALWAFVNCHSYISELINTAQLTFSGNEFDIVSYYVSSCVQYAVFALILFSLGRIMHKGVSSENDILESELISVSVESDLSKSEQDAVSENAVDEDDSQEDEKAFESEEIKEEEKEI